eukprot:NODE_333_length_1875_cov_25.423330_g240_i0.p1 GENE.NODE_333_length_1875_cov_25.423330_g240_i0~~NODE_333_length_1875_cov_25.423330_g240_i0.p1  ORF type:complete len:337 (+),score=60.45 NODE_333_length_1875_cov_25.423330_g240_i0:197-1207(+)
MGGRPMPNDSPDPTPSTPRCPCRRLLLLLFSLLVILDLQFSLPLVTIETSVHHTSNLHPAPTASALPAPDRLTLSPTFHEEEEEVSLQNLQDPERATPPSPTQTPQLSSPACTTQMGRLPGTTILSVNNNCHDQSLALIRNGTVLLLLELTKWFGREVTARCALNPTYFRHYWQRAAAIMWQLIGAQPDYHFDVGVMVGGPLMSWNYAILQQLLPCKVWCDVGHHASHAMAALFHSPFDTAAVLSIDGGGDDGVFNFYLGNKSATPPIQLVNTSLLNLGRTFILLAGVLGSVASTCLRPRSLCLTVCLAAPRKLMEMARVLPPCPQSQLVPASSPV